VSVHTFPADTPVGLLSEALAAHLRAGQVDYDGSQVAVTFDPDLATEETATLAMIVEWLRAETGLSFTDYRLIAERSAAYRTFRALSQSEFMALTANQRDRLLQDAVNDLGAILLRLLRAA
jgi:hypothetical protein